jgi:hypothetical protein
MKNTATVLKVRIEILEKTVKYYGGFANKQELKSLKEIQEVFLLDEKENAEHIAKLTFSWDSLSISATFKILISKLFKKK